MSERTFQYVTHDKIAEFEAKGWKRADGLGLEGTHHGHYAITMELLPVRDPLYAAAWDALLRAKSAIAEAERKLLEAAKGAE